MDGYQREARGYQYGPEGYQGRSKGYPSRPKGYPGRPEEYPYSSDDEESVAYRELKAQLTEYYRKGVKVSLGGMRMPVSAIAKICAVKEEGKFMGDYIIDEAGELIEIRFDRVSR